MNTTLTIRFPVCLVLISASLGFQKKPRPAETILTNGKFITVDEKKPQAEALAIRADRIVAVGSKEEIARFHGPNTKVIDIRGKTVIPGFIEGHGHFMSLGQSKMSLDLTKVRNWNEIVQMVRAAVQVSKPGEWIVGRGWHQEKWNRPPEKNVDGYPSHESLSRVSPNNPVLLTHASGHACFANKKAMELANINPKTKPPEGGEILKDSNANPIGVFRETAQAVLRREYGKAQALRTPQQRKKDRLRAFQLATEECLSNGVTSFQDAGSTFETIDQFKQWAKDGKMKLRMWVMVRDSNERLKTRLKNYRMIGFGNNLLTVRAIKRSADGALGSHGALLLKPYRDLPQSSGLRTSSIVSIQETALLAVQNDFQLCVHAIGDRANRDVLDIFQTIFRSFPHKKSLRWRVEHAQHLNPADIPRFGEMGVIASMQGIHCTSDAPYVLERLGKKRAQAGAYVWQKLMKSGALIANGTDVPVEEVDPIPNYYATVTRRLKDGSTFFPNQRMSRMEALKSYTIIAAYAAFEEKIKGSLSVGKLADLVVLSQNLLTVADDKILDTNVEMTLIGGKIVYRR